MFLACINFQLNKCVSGIKDFNVFIIGITVAWYFTDVNVIHIFDFPLFIEGMELSNFTTNFIIHTDAFFVLSKTVTRILRDFLISELALHNLWILIISVFSNCLGLSAASSAIQPVGQGISMNYNVLNLQVFIDTIHFYSMRQN